MTSSVLVLFGHGARDPEWARPLEAVRASIAQRQPGRRVELAFLEYLTPSLEDCVAQLVESGLAPLAITIVPMFIAQSGHLKRDVPERVENLRQRYPSLSITVAPVVGEVPGVIDAIAAYASDL
jgi:sirohydrochlorin cobaltochelatase